MATNFKDYFSGHANVYARSRPTYPAELFEYLASITPGHETAWDCGTGNGQAAVGLAPYFERVIATDPSDQQLSNAFPNDKVTYRKARAEESGLDSRSIDLITVAQAFHWFDIERFYEEAERVLKPDGVLAIWAYALCRISPAIDAITDDFYWNVVGPYWPKERKLVDDGYRSVDFPFDELQPPEMNIELEWTLDDLLAYFRTWSPTRRYIEANGSDPVDLIAPRLAAVWGDPGETKRVRWPMNFRVGRAPHE